MNWIWFVLGTVLIIAGLGKLRNKNWYFAALDLGVARPLLIVLPTIEILLGLSVAFGLFGFWPRFITTLLFGAFVIYVARLNIFTPNENCNCFGVSSARLSSVRFALFRNVVLFSFAIIGLLS